MIIAYTLGGAFVFTYAGVMQTRSVGGFSRVETRSRCYVCGKRKSSRLRGGTPWRYDGNASCMSEQTVILVLETSLGDERPNNKL